MPELESVGREFLIGGEGILGFLEDLADFRLAVLLKVLRFSSV